MTAGRSQASMKMFSCRFACLPRRTKIARGGDPGRLRSGLRQEGIHVSLRLPTLPASLRLPPGWANFLTGLRPCASQEKQSHALEFHFRERIRRGAEAVMARRQRRWASCWRFAFGCALGLHPVGRKSRPPGTPGLRQRGEELWFALSGDFRPRLQVMASPAGTGARKDRSSFSLFDYAQGSPRP